MGKLNQFINLLEQEAENHSIYVWGAQGQAYPTITESWIRKVETSTKNANRAIAYWKKQCAAGYEKKLKAFDCSGLGIWILQQLEIIKNDMSAAGLYSKCTKLNKSELRRGDWVFIHNGTKISHIGYIIDDDLNTIEAYGRDLGVVKRKLSQGEWNRFGRPPYFKEEIECDMSQVQTVEKPYIQVLGNSVNVRALPTTNSSIIGVAHKGERYSAADNGWHYIHFGGKDGWISSKDSLTKRVD